MYLPIDEIFYLVGIISGLVFWRLPSDKVHHRYKKEAINWLTTSNSGQVSIEFNQDNIDVFTYRRDILPRWYHQWFGILTFPE
ncbi:hypothetical protein [Proteus alimentorum]|uniref:hypothetical protein n=1 Tax=Proteus alimentorum TaxID=1973495 RepID=UPI000BFFBA0A|nr:hypothetical protein [Proteus alimentorum]